MKVLESSHTTEADFLDYCWAIFVMLKKKLDAWLKDAFLDALLNTLLDTLLEDLLDRTLF